MPRPARHYTIGEQVVVAWLKARTTRYVATESDADESIENHMPAYKVRQIGGNPDGRDRSGLTKVVQVEVEAIAADRDAMWAAVADLEAAMAALNANGLNDFYVDEVTETFSAAVVDDDNDGVRRASATFGLAVRPLPITQ